MKFCLRVVVPPLFHLPMLEEGVIVHRNWAICVGHGLSDIIQAPTGDYMVEVDGGDFFGVIRSFKKKSLMEFST